ncbi:MAG: dienelactone hydrolase family protein [Chloroflexota bacterium]
MNASRHNTRVERQVRIPIDGEALTGDLHIPAEAQGIVVFAHGSGSSRLSPRNRQVAEQLQDAGLATLLFDLLTPGEEEIDLRTRELRFDIPLLGQRLVVATDWLLDQEDAGGLAIGYFGSSTGAAAALIGAAERPGHVSAVVSRGGRPDLAGNALPRVQAPTLLIVGGRDEPVIGMNQDAMRQMSAPVTLEIVEGATHLFEEPGKLNEVTALARDWFVAHLTS